MFFGFPVSAQEADRSANPAAGSQPTGDASLTKLIEQLGATSFDRRQQAEQRLLDRGPVAIPALAEAAGRDDAEVAFRAKRVLRHLLAEQFHQTRVHLSARPQKVAWNEPFTLTITFENPTPYAAEIPLLPAGEEPAALSAEARHIGHMLDVADFLQVRGPDGSALDLHLVDIQEDPQVMRTVESRLDDGPGMILPAGAKHTLVLEAFNRGWARYRMLRAGVYEVRFEVEAERADSVSRPRLVVSNRVPVEITKGVDHPIDPDGRKLSGVLSREGDELVFTVRNCYDQPVRVHTQIGGPSDRYAQFRWHLAIGDQDHVIHVGPGDRLRGRKPAPFVALAPGASVVVLRKPIVEIGMDELPGAPASGTRVRIWGVYSNFYSRTLLNSPLHSNQSAKRGDQATEHQPPPRFIFTGSLTAEPIVVEAP